MGVPLSDSEFSKYWMQLTAVQKKSLLSIIQSFIQQREEGANLELQEAEAEYRSEDYISQEEILKQLNVSEKKSVLLLIKTFLPGKESQFVSIEEYNKEIDEAMRRIDAGELISHEDLEKEAEQW